MLKNFCFKNLIFWSPTIDIFLGSIHIVLVFFKPSPRKINAKWLSEEALQIAEKRREVKGKGEKERYTHLNVEFQRKARRDKKAS